jgi:hypothetical protein
MDGYPESLGTLIKGVCNELGAHWIAYTFVAVVFALSFNQFIR